MGSILALRKALESTISLSVVVGNHLESILLHHHFHHQHQPQRAHWDNPWLELANHWRGETRHPLHFGHVDELALADKDGNASRMGLFVL